MSLKARNVYTIEYYKIKNNKLVGCNTEVIDETLGKPNAVDFLKRVAEFSGALE